MKTKKVDDGDKHPVCGPEMDLAPDETENSKILFKKPRMNRAPKKEKKRGREEKRERERAPCPRYSTVSCSQCRHGNRPGEANAGEKMRGERRDGQRKKRTRDRKSGQRKD